MKHDERLSRRIATMSSGRWKALDRPFLLVRHCESDIVYEQLYVAYSARLSTLSAIVLTQALYDHRTDGQSLHFLRILDKRLEPSAYAELERSELASMVLEADLRCERTFEHDGLRARIVPSIPTGHVADLVFGCVLSLLEADFSSARAYMEQAVRNGRNNPTGSLPAQWVWIQCLHEVLKCDGEAARKAFLAHIEQTQAHLFGS